MQYILKKKSSLANLFMDPPNIIIFSNQSCPIKLMSEDRWKCYEIDYETFDLKSIEPSSKMF